MLKRIALLALLSLSLLSAKTYTFTIYDTAQAGGTKLQPGDYRVKLDGDQVVFMDNAGNRIDAVMKLETVDRKFEQTSITSSKEDGTNRIESIELGGTKIRIVFQ